MRLKRLNLTKSALLDYTLHIQETKSLVFDNSLFWEEQSEDEMNDKLDRDFHVKDQT